MPGELLGKECANFEMNLYFAGSNNSANFEFKLTNIGLRNRLLSFADIDREKGAFSFWLNPALTDKRVFIDSGAFSVFSRGVRIDIFRYCEWLHQHNKQITVYANLDVI